jgi:hypothetical protein
MAHVQTLIANPFALMMSLEDVLKAVEDSQHLSGLKRHVCRPLDRPIIAKAEGDAARSHAAGADADDLSAD